jgi:hypothetical protein
MPSSTEPSSTKMPTPAQLQGTLQILLAVSDAIQDLGSVPSGKLYAHLMSHMNLSSYEKVVETLKRAGLVEEHAHVLTWVGPLKALV